MVGEFALSLAGHDRGKIYLIQKETEQAVYLADGEGKSWFSPKKKNRKHIQIVHLGLSREELDELERVPSNADTVVRTCIKKYQNRKNVETQGKQSLPEAVGTSPVQDSGRGNGCGMETEGIGSREEKDLCPKLT